MLDLLAPHATARIISAAGETTVGELLSESEALARALTRWGVGPGVAVALYLPDRTEWLAVDLAVQRLGGRLVLIEPNALSDRVQAILSACPPRVVITDAGKRLATVASVLPGLGLHPLLVAVGERGDAVGAALVQRGEAELVAYRSLLQLANDAPTEVPDGDCVSFSMGLAGPPRGFVVGAAALRRQLDTLPALEPTHVQAVALSLAFPVGRLAAWRALTRGATLALVDELAPRDAMRQLTPTHVVAMPAFFERLHASIQRSFAQAGGLPLRLFRWLEGLGEEVVWAREGRREADPGVLFFHRVARRLVRKRLTRLMGGRFQRGLCALGPLAPDLARAFLAMGVEVSRSYGLAEVAPVLCRQPDPAPGGPTPFSSETIGPAVPGVELRRAEDGSLEVRAPGLAAEPLDGPALPDWRETHDLCELRDQTLLSVTARSAVLRPLAAAVDVAAPALEARLTASPYVATAVVVGDGRPFLSALVVLDTEGMIPFAREQGLAVAHPSELADRPEVFALINGLVGRINRELPSWEAITKFAILDHPLGPGRGELAVSRLPRRQTVLLRHAALIESMYREQF